MRLAMFNLIGERRKAARNDCRHKMRDVVHRESSSNMVDGLWAGFLKLSA